MTTDKNNAAPDLQPAELAERRGVALVTDAMVDAACKILHHGYDHESRKAYREACQKAARQALEAALAARQPGAQEPTHWQHCEVPHLCITDATKRELKEGETGRGIRKIDNAYSIPAYAAPTAQGIDLGQLRKLAMPILCGMLCASDAERACRRLHAALIDQRDAAPGVGS